MRAVIFILVVVILVIIAGIATGFLDINQTRGAKAPQVSASQNGVTAAGGQAPAFDIETGQVKVGAKSATVKVPTIEVQAPQNQTAPATNAAQ